jgi:predicted dinucleotide-binding enzyme
MRIGLIGSGRIGSTVARLAIAQGHEVVLSNSRGPETLADLVAELGSRSSAATVIEAAEAGEVVVVTVPLKAYTNIPVEPLRGKIVIDTNNYYPDRDGRIAALDDGSTTSSELLADHLPQSRIVKAFNTIYFVHLGEDGLPAGDAARRALPIAGDDATAKATVSALIDSFGFDVVDAGPLAAGRAIQPDTAVYNVRQTRAELTAGLGV